MGAGKRANGRPLWSGRLVVFYVRKDLPNDEQVFFLVALRTAECGGSRGDEGADQKRGGCNQRSSRRGLACLFGGSFRGFLGIVNALQNGN